MFPALTLALFIYGRIIMFNRKEYNKKYYQKNREKILKQAKQYQEDNSEKISITRNKHYKNNRDNILEQMKQYRQDNKENISKQNKYYRENNIGKIKKYRENNSEYFKKYYQDNQEKILEYRRNHKDKTKEYGKRYQENNKVDINIKHKKWKKNNPEKVSKSAKRYHGKNRDNILKYKREYYKNNKDKSLKYSQNHRKEKNEYNKNKRKTDLRLSLNHKISTLMRMALKGNKNGWHWETLVGYTLIDLIKRLNKTMPKNYTWQDYLDGKLHIDHIVPISVYNFTKPEHIDFKRCWGLSNLRLLPAEENLRKNSKLEKPFQPALKI